MFILFVSISYFIWTNRPILLVQEHTVELSKNIQLKKEDFIDPDSKNIQLDQIKLSCDFEYKGGKYPATLTCHNTTKKTFLIIQDTTCPVFTTFNEELILYTNDDILSHFEAKDESEVQISILDEINTSKPIDTILHIQAIDAYQNKTIRTCHLIIKKKEKIHHKNPSSIPPSQNTNTNEEIPVQDYSPAFEVPQNTSPSAPVEPTYEEPITPACGYSGSVGNSGLTFSSYGEAIAYADTFLMENVWTYSGYSTEKIGCPDIWTVNFY